MRKVDGHLYLTGHNTCQAYRVVFQSPMEIVKCVGNQGVVRAALNSHAERERVRACVSACVYVLIHARERDVGVLRCGTGARRRSPQSGRSFDRDSRPRARSIFFF